MVLFLILSIAFPALAVGEGFDKAWAEAPPGWYLRGSFSIGYIAHDPWSSMDWWHKTRYWIVGRSMNEGLILVSTNIDQRNKPIFVRKISTPQSGIPGCREDEMLFRINGEEVKIPASSMQVFNSDFDPSNPPFEYMRVYCHEFITWELLRKSCGNENFIVCMGDKFSKKFPFDILFNLPSAKITCPKVNFFASEFDLCFIYEAMRMMKYPIAAALIMKIFLYL